MALVDREEEVASEQAILPRCPSGDTSPYPTVVKVTIMHLQPPAQREDALLTPAERRAKGVKCAGSA